MIKNRWVSDFILHFTINLYSYSEMHLHFDSLSNTINPIIEQFVDVFSFCFALQKYNIITFLPLVLFQQFRFFLNLYFLIMAISQFLPDVRIGYLYTYVLYSAFSFEWFSFKFTSIFIKLLSYVMNNKNILNFDFVFKLVIGVHLDLF